MDQVFFKCCWKDFARCKDQLRSVGVYSNIVRLKKCGKLIPCIIVFTNWRSNLGWS